MTEDLNVFPNAKSPLFGAGEDSVGIIVTPATAGLTGDAVLVDDVAGSGSQVGTSSNFIQDFMNFTNVPNGGIAVSLTVTTPTNPSVLLLYTAWVEPLNGGTATIRIKRDTVNYLSTFGVTKGGISTNLQVDTNPLSGSHTYTLGPTGSGITPWRIVFIAKFISLNDTHDGFIQTVAIAGKQINAADTHTTREITVLPG